jgi:hypothetical protein
MGLTNYLAKAQTLGMSRSGALFLLCPVTKSSNCSTSPNPRYAATYSGNDSSAPARRAMRKSVLLAFMLSISPKRREISVNMSSIGPTSNGLLQMHWVSVEIPRRSMC